MLSVQFASADSAQRVAAGQILSKLQPSGVLSTTWLLPDIWKVVAEYLSQKGKQCLAFVFLYLTDPLPNSQRS
jgi:hypothetical protein